MNYAELQVTVRLSVALANEQDEKQTPSYPDMVSGFRCFPVATVRMRPPRSSTCVFVLPTRLCTDTGTTG